MARPKLNIDPEIVLQLSKLQCTYREMAEFLGCDEKTLRNRFSAEIDKGRESGKISLRRMQWRSAEAGSHTMLIWLGKQYLGQTDKVEEKITENDKSYIINLIPAVKPADNEH